MLLTYILIFIFLVIFSIVFLYVFSTYFAPRKLDEIAAMIENGQLKLAIKKLTAIIEKDEGDAYARYLLAEAYRRDGSLQYAVIEYRQVLKLGAFDNNVKEVDIRTKLAGIFKQQKKLGEAKDEYLILTKIDPANFQNFYELGLIFYNAGVLDKAVGYFKKSVSINNKDIMSFYYLGQIYYRGSNYQDAKDAFVETLKLDNQNYKAHYFLGLVLRHIGDYEWAVKEFEIAQKSDEIKPKCYLAKGTCFLEKEQYPKAIVEFEKGIKFVQKGSETELNMRFFAAMAYEKMRDMESAIRNWEAIYEVNKKFRDVDQKLKQFAEFRQDDRIKDFMIASLANFEFMARKIVESMGLVVREVDIISDTDIEIFAAEPDDNRRNTRKIYKVIRILRTTDLVSDGLLRKLHESLKPRNAQRVVIVTTGEFSQSALDFANTRPVDLIGKSQLVDILKSVQ